ncbi:hypothetical protein T484DRAFT_1817419 [Baffinella frigidus]|nr:hypothetical protein T484DRAFT_1817419 [Cryptophyta sp. CCMP2293]
MEPQRSTARMGKSDLPNWANHLVTSINREPSHVPLMCFTSEASALSAKLEHGVKDAPFLKTISGPASTWNFRFSETPDQAPEVKPGGGFAGSSSWSTIRVPSCWECEGYGQAVYTNFQYPFKSIRVSSCWECEGYGQAVYTNFQYPFKVDPPKIPAGTNHVGSYQTVIKIPSGWEERRTFLYFETVIEIPSGWEERRTFLYFEGVSSAFELWINGAYVGYSQDSRLPAEFDITQAAFEVRIDGAFVGYFQDSCLPAEFDITQADVNLRIVGYSQDSHLPAEFDITQADSHLPAEFDITQAVRGSSGATPTLSLRVFRYCDGIAVRRSSGAALTLSLRVFRYCDGSYLEDQGAGVGGLSLRVFRYCDGSYLEDQDQWWLSGIHRDVLDQWWLSGIHRDVLVYSKPDSLYIADYEPDSLYIADYEVRAVFVWVHRDVLVYSKPDALYIADYEVIPWLIAPEIPGGARTAEVIPRLLAPEIPGGARTAEVAMRATLRGFFLSEFPDDATVVATLAGPQTLQVGASTLDDSQPCTLNP